MEEPRRSYLILAIALIIVLSFGFWLLLSPGTDPTTGRFVTQSPTPCGGATPCSCGDTVTSTRTLTATDAGNLANCAGTGLYMETNGVVLDCADYTISGDGGITGIRIQGQQPLSGITVKNCNIENFQVGILGSDLDELTIENNNIRNPIVTALDTTATQNTRIALSKVNDSIIKDNNVSNSENGITAEQSLRNTFQNNIANNNACYGIKLQDSADNTITGGEASNNGADLCGDRGGVVIKSSLIGLDVPSIKTEDNTVTGVTLESNQGPQQIKLWGANGTTITNNVIDGNTGAPTTTILDYTKGIYSLFSDDVVIQNNDIFMNRGYGIHVAASDNTHIINNDIYNNWHSGIVIDGSPGLSDHLVQGNTITDNGIAGTDPLLEGSAGIKLLDERTSIIKENIIDHPFPSAPLDASPEAIDIYFGIYLKNSYNNQVLKNTVDNADYGIYVFGTHLKPTTVGDGGGYNIISQNTMRDNFQSGIYIASENNTVIDNTISRPSILGPAVADFNPQDSGFGGISLIYRNFNPTGNHFEGNTVSHYQFGFKASHVSDFTIANGNYFNNNMGLYFSEGSSGTVTGVNAHHNCVNGLFLEGGTTTVVDSDFNYNDPALFEKCEQPVTTVENFYSGLFLAGTTLHLTNSDFIDNYDWGFWEYAMGDTVHWTLTENVRCTNNDINITGTIVPLGGSIIANNCNVWLNGELLDVANGEMGGVSMPLDTNNPGQTDTTGNGSVGVELEVHTNGGFTGNVNVEFYDQNPGGDGFFLSGIGKWINITTSGPINVNWMIIKVYYGDNDVRGMIENTLRLEYYNATNGTWQKYDPPQGGVDTVNNYVWANVTHFSIYGIGGTKKPADSRGGGGSGIYEKDIGEITETGTSFQSKVDEIVYFTYKDNGYTLVLNGNTPAGSMITVGGTSITLQSGTTQDLDLNNNGQTDTQLKVTSVQGSIANMFLQAIPETVTAPTPIVTPIVETKTVADTLEEEEIIPPVEEIPGMFGRTVPEAPPERAAVVEQPTGVEEKGSILATLIPFILGILVIGGIVIYAVMHKGKEEPPKVEEPKPESGLPKPEMRGEEPKPESIEEPIVKTGEAPKPAQPAQSELPEPEEVPKAFGEEPKQPEVQPPQS